MHHIRNLNFQRQLPHIDLVLQRDVRGGRALRVRARNISQPFCRVQLLPLPPQAVKVCVVEVE